MRVRSALILAAAAALFLAGCATEIASDVDEGGFGNPNMNNTLFMTGQRSYVQALGERFAREVPDTVNFDFDSARLDAEAQAVLRRQADWIRQFPEVRFRVYGHTDLVGSDAYNRALGLRRAQAVVAYLATQGISRSRLEAVVSFGRTRPVIQTADPERRNRRTVTEVTGFVERHPTVLNGKYAEVVFREYITGEAGARFRHPPNVAVTTETRPGG
jgi:outer membrane protein OmpA-like peptidoglycan-associated protein